MSHTRPRKYSPVILLDKKVFFCYPIGQETQTAINRGWDFWGFYRERGNLKSYWTQNMKYVNTLTLLCLAL